MAAKMPKIGKLMFLFLILIYKFIKTRVNPDAILLNVGMNPSDHSQGEKCSFSVVMFLLDGVFEKSF